MGRLVASNGLNIIATAQYDWKGLQRVCLRERDHVMSNADINYTGQTRVFWVVYRGETLTAVGPCVADMMLLRYLNTSSGHQQPPGLNHREA